MNAYQRGNRDGLLAFAAWAEAAFSPLAAAKATWASRAHQRAAYIRSLPQRFGEGRPMPPTSEDGDDG